MSPGNNLPLPPKHIFIAVSILPMILLNTMCFNIKTSTETKKPSGDSQKNALLPNHFSEAILRQKRSEIDLQTCIDNFNIHRDKIIRTQDSQNMGAKYLNEIDLGSREECLRLCCETEDCDVFVFEEKNSGSCYLFHCGPPEDFKCKFTHHVNYSSAVLSINRHLPDLESQIKLTKHVQDLTKLRKSEAEASEILRLIPNAQELPKTTPSTTLASLITKEVNPMEKQLEARKCSRYQFECRSTGECIAIYNACDGIPQCADGSDEAHELGCPAPEAVAGANAAALTTVPPQPRKVAQPAVQQQQVQPAQTQQSQSVQQYGREGDLVQPPQPPKIPSSNYQPLYHPQPQIPQIQLQAEPDFLRPVADPRNPGRTQYEPVMPMQNYIGVPNGWIPRQQIQQGIQQMQQLPQYQENGDHLFVHKENSAFSEGQLSQIQYPEYAVKAPSYYGDNYRQPIQQDNWPIDDIKYVPQQKLHSQDNLISSLPDKTEGNNHPSETTQQKQDTEKPLKPDTNTKHLQEKLAHDLKHSKDSMEHGTNQKTKFQKVVNREPYPDVVAYKMIDDTQDGPSHIPRGAILSLTIGLIITGVMAILIGCRLRVVRRRLRKGGKGYAHDADYLVNGMYL